MSVSNHNFSEDNSQDFSHSFSQDPDPIKKLKTETTPQGINIQKDNNGDASLNPTQDGIEEKKDSVENNQINTSHIIDKRSKRQKSTSTNANDELKNEYNNDPSAYVDSYEFLKYKENTYKINDTLAIRNEADFNNDFVCKLTRIIRPRDLESSKVLAFLEVQWYYRKADLAGKKYEPFLPHFSENEVFLTNQRDFVSVDCINSIANVLSYDEYDSLSKILPNTYYCRANFDVTKKKIIPPIEKWAKHCICKTPLNPDYMYVQCDLCNGWYHIECLKLSEDEAQALETYVCKDCELKEKGTVKTETTTTVSHQV